MFLLTYTDPFQSLSVGLNYVLYGDILYFHAGIQSRKSLGWDKLVLVQLCWHVWNFLMACLSSQRWDQVIKFRDVTQDYMVACNGFHCCIPAEVRRRPCNDSSHPTKWQGL